VDQLSDAQGTARGQRMENRSSHPPTASFSPARRELTRVFLLSVSSRYSTHRSSPGLSSVWQLPASNKLSSSSGKVSKKFAPGLRAPAPLLPRYQTDRYHRTTAPPPSSSPARPFPLSSVRRKLLRRETSSAKSTRFRSSLPPTFSSSRRDTSATLISRRRSRSSLRGGIEIRR
jgi:hypothetical protein